MIGFQGLMEVSLYVLYCDVFSCVYPFLLFFSWSLLACLLSMQWHGMYQRARGPLIFRTYSEWFRVVRIRQISGATDKVGFVFRQVIEDGIGEVEGVFDDLSVHSFIH